MGIYRTYFNKNATLISGSTVNTGRNPITELSYGSVVTRLLINVDLTDMKKKVQNREITLTGARHILKMRSTLDFSINPYLSEFHQIEVDNTYRPTSFDLELHSVDQSWDEGKGYDFTLNTNRRPEDVDFLQSPTNWYQATTLTPWTTPGAVASGSTLVAVQHFDVGNEDVEMDITDYVNGVLVSSGTTGVTEVNMCLKYNGAFENAHGDKQYVTGFFTRHTQSFFEPFIETVYDDVIRDDRQKFFLNKTNRLYLYVNVGGKLTNLDAMPTCVINLAPMVVRQQSTGVYYAEVDASNNGFISEKKYHDTWSNLTVNGRALPDVTLNFIPKDAEEYYQLTTEIVLPERYGVSVSGIKQEEKVTSGEKRRIQVHVRKPYTVNQNELIDDMQYRIYVKLGAAQMTIVDWSDVSRSNLYNFFTLDTNWLVPQKYYVDIKVNQNGETILYNDQLVFNVVSRKNM